MEYQLYMLYGVRNLLALLKSAALLISVMAATSGNILMYLFYSSVSRFDCLLLCLIEKTL